VFANQRGVRYNTNMNYMKKSNIYLSICLAVVFILICWFFVYRLFLPNELSFKRFHFNVQQKKEEFSFNPDTFSWSGESQQSINFGGNITRGTGILIDGQGRLSLKPGLQGNKGFFLIISAKSRDQDKLKVTLTFKGNGAQRILDQFESEKAYHDISKTLKFHPDDEIIIAATGKGMLIVGDPVIYDIIDQQKRKYIFVIGLDTLRGDKIGFKRRDILLTPHLNAFKSDAVTFSNAFAQSSWTLPSFMSLFTGLYEYNHQAPRNSHLSSQKPFLIKDISTRFITAYIHGGTFLTAKYGNSKGADYFASGSTTKDKNGGQQMFKAAINFMEKNPVPSLFMFLHTYQIHHPYEPPEEFLYQWDKNPKYKKQSTFFYRKQYNRFVPPKERQTIEELYECEILAFDYYFGEFIHYLKSEGIYEQSLIVFLSDHGEEFYEHQGWAHGHSLYNEVLKIPLLVKFPGNQFANRVVEENAGIIDVFPTLLDYYHIEHHDKLDGVSLLPLLTKGNLSREYLAASTSHCRLVKRLPPKFAILFDDYKLIYNYKLNKEVLDYFSEFGLPPNTGDIELYDLKNDPGEKINLYPEKRQLPGNVRAAIVKIVNRINENMRIIQKETITLDAQDREQLKTLGYL
jgi:choline-sulfatase